MVRWVYLLISTGFRPMPFDGDRYEGDEASRFKALSMKLDCILRPEIDEQQVKHPQEPPTHLPALKPSQELAHRRQLARSRSLRSPR